VAAAAAATTTVTAAAAATAACTVEVEASEACVCARARAYMRVRVADLIRVRFRLFKSAIFSLYHFPTRTHTHTHAHKTLSQARSSTHIHAVLARLFYLPLSRSPHCSRHQSLVFFMIFALFVFSCFVPARLSLSLSLSLSINLSLHRSSGLRTARPLFRLETKYHNADNTAHTSLIFSYFFVSCLVCLIWRPSSSCLLPFLIPTACLNKQTEMARSPFILVFFSSVKPII